MEHPFDAQHEPDHHQAAVLIGEALFLELLKVVQREGLGGRDVDGPSQKVRQGRGGRAHHLVHDLADGADGHIVQLELLVGRLASHQDIHDGLDVAAPEHHDVAAFQARDILDLDADGRLQVSNAEVLHRDDLHPGRRDIHAVIEHIGDGGGRGSQADVHEFADGVKLHRIKNCLTHAPYFSSLFCKLQVSTILTAMLPSWVPSLPLNQGFPPI